MVSATARFFEAEPPPAPAPPAVVVVVDLPVVPAVAAPAAVADVVLPVLIGPRAMASLARARRSDFSIQSLVDGWMDVNRENRRISRCG